MALDLSGFATGERPDRGLLISFSGIDGSGKTTSIRALRRLLAPSWRDVHTFKLPSNECKTLAVFRDYVHDPMTAQSGGRVDLFSMFLAVTGDRLNTIRTRIMPLLERNAAVLVDRYLYAAICEVAIADHQFAATEIDAMRGVVAQFPTPHLSVFTRASLVEATARIRARPAEADVALDYELVRRRIIEFERLRRHFDGATVDSTLDPRSCLQVMKRHVQRRMAADGR
jgi:thymidylate kinase